MMGVSQSEVAAQLQAQLDKLRAADPFRTLGVPAQVDGEGVRHAYLSLTKKLHPNRFALEPASTREIANEVFLLIRRAYDLLADEDKRRQWRERVAPGPATSPPAATTAKVTTTRPTQPGVATVPATGSTPPRSATLTPARPARSTGAPPPATAPRAPVATPAARPQTAQPRNPTVPGTAPPPAGARRPLVPTQGMGASPQEVQAMLELARTRGQRFDDAVALLSRGKYREAREAFYKIAMEDPQSRRYRAQLHFAWGMEHLADGKAAEAQRELERALALENESHDIKAGLAKAQELQKKPSGILGKLFGR